MNDLQNRTLNEDDIEVEKNVFKVKETVEYSPGYREGKNINITKGIMFENNNKGKLAIIKLLEDNIENFDINNYEMDI